MSEYAEEYESDLKAARTDWSGEAARRFRVKYPAQYRETVDGFLDAALSLDPQIACSFNLGREEDRLACDALLETQREVIGCSRGEAAASVLCMLARDTYDAGTAIRWAALLAEALDAPEVAERLRETLKK